jgi:hypothetical protein
VWNVKTNVIPETIRATETILKSFRKYLCSVPAKHEIKGLQKTAILDTAHTAESRCNIANSVISTVNSNYRTAATLHALGTRFVSGI